VAPDFCGTVADAVREDGLPPDAQHRELIAIEEEEGAQRAQRDRAIYWTAVHGLIGGPSEGNPRRRCRTYPRTAISRANYPR
jgi:hypothetical protein